MTEKSTEQSCRTYPVLPLRDIVVLPYMIAPLFVGRERSLNAVKEARDGCRQIVVVTQKEPSREDPEADSLYKVGTLGRLLQCLKLPDGTVKVLVEGESRALIKALSVSGGCWRAEVEVRKDQQDNQRELKVLSKTLVTQFERYAKMHKKIPSEVLAKLEQVDRPGEVADIVAAHVSLKIADKQEVLEAFDLAKRLELLCSLVAGEIGLLQVEGDIRQRVKSQMEKTQRDYVLNEQLKAIQKELGEGDHGREELSELEARIKKTKFPAEAMEKAMGELKKLRSMSSISPEATVIRNYLDWLTSIPWDQKSQTNEDLKQAEAILEQDHYALEKVKERILEYLAVQQRSGKVRGPILCLVGAPGVGKTSLGKSVARATGRNFIRTSLGGVRDEAEIRGHRRTYIGSMPGRIIQSMKKAKSSNPLFLLDEIDKLGADWRGDPASALLEVLDQEQNSAFNDHYLEVDYDLSDVMFICTANTTRMAQPLLDRMEIIRLAGYTADEKVEIAFRHLVGKQTKDHGLKSGEFSITKSAMIDLIRHYTREAGVRNLEREIANLARKAVRGIVAGEFKKLKVTRRNLSQYAGVRRYQSLPAEGVDMVGCTNGLAWTEVGGVLLSVEAVWLHGKGKVHSTGKLGDVMRESVQAAESYVKSRCLEFGLKPSEISRRDVHVHIPEGATPKDGPSAGVAMVTAIVSVLSGIPVRGDVAMTGEITLRGRVLQVGGLKEKLLAAASGGIKKVLIPKDNHKDLTEIPDNVTESLVIVPVKTLDEVLQHALVNRPVPIRWSGELEGESLQAINVGVMASTPPKGDRAVRH